MLYNHFIVAYITLSSVIYDLPVAFAAIATNCLKKWLGVTKTNNESSLFRSRDVFGLGHQSCDICEENAGL